MTNDAIEKELARLRTMERDLQSGEFAGLPKSELRDLLYQVRLQITDIELTTTLNKAHGRKGAADRQGK